MRTLLRAVLTTLLCLTAAGARAGERLSLDADWRFHLGNEWGQGVSLAKAGTGYGPAGTTFSDASWRHVKLPHDWAVELPFDEHADGSHGFKAIGPGFPQNNIGWYRRAFSLPASDAGRRIWLEFDGVYRDCTVFVNGWRIGRHESGYSSFRYDVTDMVTYGGRNTLAVRVDASLPEGWFYEGAGIYRHVWLVKTPPVALAPDGVFVRSTLASADGAASAELSFGAEIRNQENAAAGVIVQWDVADANGHLLGSTRAETTAPAMAISAPAQSQLHLNHPALWSPETPVLYELVTKLVRNGRVVDETRTAFGIRTFGFDTEKGFLLNGRPYPLRGTCNHQDHAGVGSALPDALEYFRIAKLKEMGSNAYRTSHNPPTPELLEACDRLGMLVMDENRLLGSDVDTQQRWAEQIRRDRNHACVAIWSVANEEFTVQATPAGAHAAATLQEIAHRIDPTRPTTYAAPVGNEFAGINSIIEVRGWNYHVGPDMDAYHLAHPHQPNVGTEQGSTTGTRGIYADDPVRGYVSAFDDWSPEWATTAHRWVTYFASRPWLSGGFVWTGFDYRGEPTPYSWPCINSHFGIMDTCGFPKDNFWYYQCRWTDTPVLHLFPHWNRAGSEGKSVEVRAFTNCDAVELTLNGRDLGRQSLTEPGQLKWTVPYSPGRLAARGFRRGAVVVEKELETTGAPARLQLRVNRREISADGRDAAVVAVMVVDARGRVVPDASVKVAFDVSGPAAITGVGNGDPSCHEPDKFISLPRLDSRALGGWRWHTVADTYASHIAETAPEYADADWKSFDADAEHGSLGVRERAVIRGTVNVTDADFAADGLELKFGRIEGDASVYLNGEKLGPGGDPSAPVIFDVKSKLKPGRNVIAIAVTNFGGQGGLAKGVSLRHVWAGQPVQWSRSTFNGLAETILQSGGAPGTITLRAEAAGLAPGTLTLVAAQ